MQYSNASRSVTFKQKESLLNVNDTSVYVTSVHTNPAVC